MTFDLAHNDTATLFLLQQWQSWLPKSNGTPASSPWTAAGFLVILASRSPTLPLSCQCCSWRKADTWYSEDSSFCLRDLISGSAPTAEEQGRGAGGGVAGQREGKRDGGRECLCVMTITKPACKTQSANCAFEEDFQSWISVRQRDMEKKNREKELGWCDRQERWFCVYACMYACVYACVYAVGVCSCKV